MILDGIYVRNQILDNIKKEVEDNKFDITLAIIFVGDNKASSIYVKNKIKYAGKCNIKTKLIKFPEDASYDAIKSEIIKLNNDDKITGIIVQLPLKNKEDESVVEYIDPKKDVDGFTKQNKDALLNNEKCIYPCTPRGILKLLEYYNIDVANKKVCILGRGKLVGHPLAIMMKNKNAIVTVCHSKTLNEEIYTKDADIIVCAVGKAHLLTKDMVKNGAIVVDAGISFEDKKQVGDADFDDIKNICKYITPNPGGVGPMTVAMIMQNLLDIKKGE